MKSGAKLSYTPGYEEGEQAESFYEGKYIITGYPVVYLMVLHNVSFAASIGRSIEFVGLH